MTLLQWLCLHVTFWTFQCNHPSRTNLTSVFRRCTISVDRKALQEGQLVEEKDREGNCKLNELGLLLYNSGDLIAIDLTLRLSSVLKSHTPYISESSKWLSEDDETCHSVLQYSVILCNNWCFSLCNGFFHNQRFEICTVSD